MDASKQQEPVQPEVFFSMPPGEGPWHLGNVAGVVIAVSPTAGMFHLSMCAVKAGLRARWHRAQLIDDRIVVQSFDVPM